MLFNTTNLPSVRVQIRNSESRDSEEIITSLIDLTDDLNGRRCETFSIDGFKYLLVNRTTDRSLAFTPRTYDVAIQEFISEMGDVELFRITGYVPSIKAPTIATKPVDIEAELKLLSAGFPFLSECIN